MIHVRVLCDGIMLEYNYKSMKTNIKRNMTCVVANLYVCTCRPMCSSVWGVMCAAAVMSVCMSICSSVYHFRTVYRDGYTHHQSFIVIQKIHHRLFLTTKSQQQRVTFRDVISFIA